MKRLSDHNIPWDLIVASLQNNISAEEDARLEAWLLLSDENQQFFNQLAQTWTTELSDYTVYQAADETVAWDALRSKMENKNNIENAENTVIKGTFNKSSIILSRWVAAAAIVILVSGYFFWFGNNRKSIVYQTGKNEQRTVVLADGSSIQLFADSRIEIAKDYNRSARLINFTKGEAFFEVIHNEQIPFIVNMRDASIKDIGTGFYVHNTRDSIKVSVTSGKLDFINKTGNETRRLSAGMRLKFFTTTKNSPPVIEVDSTSGNHKNPLQFDKIFLSDVILTMQEAFNKKIVIIDTAIAQKRFTANLEGQSFEGAMEILSQSLGIRYYTENGIYYLKGR